MRTDRFYIQSELKNGELIIKDERIVHQLKNVLRMEPGSGITLFNGGGGEWHGTIRDINKEECLVSIDGEIFRETEPQRTVHAGICILKKEYFELVAQKLVEAGVSSITPVISTHTVKTNIDKERIIKIMIEAAEQSGRTIIPELKEAVSVKDFIKHNKNIVVFHIDGDPYRDPGDRTEVSFLVGPEGGWSIQELSLFAEERVPLYSLGRTILRGETAAIVGAHKLVWD